MPQYKQLISYIFAFLILTYYSFNNTQVTFNGTLQQCILFLLIALFILYLFTRTFKIKELVIYFVFAILGIVSYLSNHSTLFLILALSLAVFSTFSIKELLSFFVIYRSIFISIIIFLSLIGVLNNNGREMYKSSVDSSVNTYSLGFGHPNQAAQAIGILLIVIFLLMLNNKNLLFEKFLFGIVFIAGFYWITKSRTFFVCCFLALLIGVIQWIPFFEKSIKWIKKGYFLIELIIIFFGLILPALFSRFASSPFVNVLDQIASGRISFSASVFSSYPITLFGSNFDSGFTELQHIYGMGKYAVDNGYISFLFTYGLLYTVIYFVMLNILIKKLLQDEKYYFVWIILIVSIWGLFENIVWIPILNITLLLWSQGLSRKLSCKKTKQGIHYEGQKS